MVEILISVISASFAVCQTWFESWFKLVYLCITWLSGPFKFLIDYFYTHLFGLFHVCTLLTPPPPGEWQFMLSCPVRLNHFTRPNHHNMSLSLNSRVGPFIV